MRESSPKNISDVRNEITYMFIERKSPLVLTQLSLAPVFKKQGTVQARPAQIGENIVTKLASGLLETTNISKISSWVIKNPSGEEYLLSAEQFKERYEATDSDGIYAATGYCRAIKNIYKRPITIIAPWGEPQVGEKECMIADTCDAQGHNMGGEPYLIEANAFAATYRRAS